jgi:hypothetical protein
VLIRQVESLSSETLAAQRGSSLMDSRSLFAGFRFRRLVRRKIGNFPPGNGLAVETSPLSFPNRNVFLRGPMPRGVSARLRSSDTKHP